jgi:hypothetical protein
MRARSCGAPARRAPRAPSPPPPRPAPAADPPSASGWTRAPFDAPARVRPPCRPRSNAVNPHRPVPRTRQGRDELQWHGSSSGSGGAYFCRRPRAGRGLGGWRGPPGGFASGEGSAGVGRRAGAVDGVAWQRVPIDSAGARRRRRSARAGRAGGCGGGQTGALDKQQGVRHVLQGCVPERGGRRHGQRRPGRQGTKCSARQA